MSIRNKKCSYSLIILLILFVGLFVCPQSVRAGSVPRYTVNFWADPEMTSIAKSIYVDEGQLIPTSELPTTPYIEGYDFKGYCWIYNGVEHKWDMGTTCVYEDVDLYPKFEAIVYEMTLDINAPENEGAFFQDGTSHYSKKTYKKNYNEPYGDLPIGTRKGYDFLGWYPSDDPTQTVIDSPAKKITRTETLLAKWKVQQYTLKFELAGDVPTSEAPSIIISPASITVDYGEQLTTLPEPVRYGYIFMGWKINSSGSGTIYNNGDYYKDTVSRTLYAVWKNNHRTLYFDPLEYEYVIPGTYTRDCVIFGDLYGALPDLVPVKGYTFMWWCTGKNGTGARVTPTTVIAEEHGDTLYPYFTPNKYWAFFDANGGQSPISKMQVTYDEKSDLIPLATRYGYDFQGWFDQQTGGTQYDKTTPYSYDSDMTFYAHWTPKNVKITFDPCGGTMTNQSSTITRKFDTKYFQGANGEPTPVRLGYQFTGWYTEKEEDRGKRISTANRVAEEKNHTLYARWKPITYAVSFETNGAVEQVDDIYVQVGDTYGDLPSVTRPGYEFLGWYTSGEGGFKVTPETELLITELTLYARWKQSEIKVTFDGCGGNVSAASKKVAYLEPYGELAIATRSGYAFKGWYDSKELGSLITAETKVKKTEDHSLYAKWEALLTPTPTKGPSPTPTKAPTPTGTPTKAPTGTPTKTPTGTPTKIPTGTPRHIEDYKDVPKDAWYTSAVSFAVENGILAGYDDNTFRPDELCTREQFVRILYNAANKPQARYIARFVDVPKGRWYSNSISWAVNAGITAGISGTEFGVGQPITREQVSVMIYHFAIYNNRNVEGRSNIIKFTDAMQVSRWAHDPLSWANYSKIINGYKDGRLGPKDYCTRAQIAKMMMSYYGK